MKDLHLAIITDIHYGPNVMGKKRINKFGQRAIPLTKKFIQAANQKNVDAIADLGDRITAEKREIDTERMREISIIFNEASSPIYTIPGNHCSRRIHDEDYQNIIGRSKESYSLDLNRFHLVFWAPDLSHYYGQGLLLRPDDLEWLRQDIDRTDKPVILFSHVPIDLDRKPPDNKSPTKYFAFPNASDARRILEESGKKITLCLAGHRHINAHNIINDIHYITQQSLTQAQRGFMKRSPYGAYSFLKGNAENGSLQLNLQGKYKKNYVLDF